MQQKWFEQLIAFAQALREAGLRDAGNPMLPPLDDNEWGVDAILPLAGQPVSLEVKQFAQTYPRDIRGAIYQLTERFPEGEARPILICLGNISPGARALLRERRMAYFDDDGSLFFCRGQTIVSIERPALPARKRQAQSLFVGARENVIHALLHMQGEWTNGLQLALHAGVSNATVSSVLKELEAREWADVVSAGRNSRARLAQPGTLLDAWVQAASGKKPITTKWFCLATRPHELLPSLCAKLKPQPPTPSPPSWFLTGLAAGNQISPLLTSVETLEVTVHPGDAGVFARDAGLSAVQSGANVVIYERDTSGSSWRFRARDNVLGCDLASPWTIYVDLMREERGRFKELARQIRADILKV